MIKQTSLSSCSLETERLLLHFRSRQLKLGVIGLGYVGLPLCLAAAGAGLRVIGFDIDPSKAESLNKHTSYLRHISSEQVGEAIASGRLEPTSDFGRLGNVDAIIICVPTPLTAHLAPDLSFVVSTAETIARHLHRGQIVILESTTYPGTTREVIQPILERGGLRRGEDFFLAFSPEREDPGNAHFTTSEIPKVVGADSPFELEIASSVYSHFFSKIVEVSSTQVAEAVKLTENIFRAVNIALVNELKIVYEQMGIDVWEVIEAAKTKPFGFMPFYPGPGLGGHCIPIDPFYLTWKAREYGMQTHFIELAGQINSSMPKHVVAKLAASLDSRQKRGLNGARVLVVGIAYKKNVDDMRESPALRLIELIETRGAQVEYFDPLVPIITPTREHPGLTGRQSASWRQDLSADFDAILIVTDHDAVEYEALVANASLVIDTRNVCRRRGINAPNIVLA